MKISLNRFHLIESVDYNTPLCVLQEIIRCLGMSIEIEDIPGNVDAMIEYMKTTEIHVPFSETNEYTEDELAKISTFVSQTEGTWTNDNLIKAFRHLVEFEECKALDIHYGPKTTGHPFSHDATMLYIHCVKHNIDVKNTDTFQDLVVYTKLTFAKTDALLDALCTKVCDITKGGIINMIKVSRQQSDEFEFSDVPSGRIQQLKNSVISRSVLTDDEAVVVTAREFGIDISESSRPSREIIELQKGLKFHIDDDFTRNYKRNPLYYDMTRFWKTHLSHLYTQKMEMKLLDNECVNHQEISDPKQFLYELTLTKNIYQGVIPGVPVTETYVYRTPVGQLNPRHLLSYGVLQSKDMIVLTANEISNFFKSHCDFRDFKNEGQIISERNMKKLVMICSQFPQEQEFLELLQTIEDTKTLGTIVNGSMREFIAHCKASDSLTTQKINGIITKLFLLAMNMRGWTGNGEHPLAERRCQDYAERFEQIEDTSTQGLRELIQLINELPDATKIMVKGLPLIKLSERDKTYYRSTNPDEGLTIYDRLVLISTKPDSIYACMRLSSNYLAATAQYYNALINSKNFFDIKDLEFIQ